MPFCICIRTNTFKSEEDSSDDENDEKKDNDKKDPDKKDDDRKDSDKKDDKDEKDEKGDKAKAKATGSQGSTPQGKKGEKKSKSLKRAGSPALSESSGNESSRKKIKKTTSAATGSRAGTPIPGALRKGKMGAGSTSDGEATAGEMSDGAGPRKKIKLVGSTRGTPSASRAGSPAPAGKLAAASVWPVTILTRFAGASPSPSTAGIEPWEILEKIPEGGISIGELIKPFQTRVGVKPGQMAKKDWIKLVTQLCEYGPDKLLRKRK